MRIKGDVASHVQSLPREEPKTYHWKPGDATQKLDVYGTVTMNINICGGCLCGAVRYQCSEHPISMGLCQCDRCQRQSGSAFLIATVFKAGAVKIDGELRTFAASGEDGQTLARHFCPVCGSAVMITLDRYPDIRSMMGGTLDDKSLLKPTFSLWCSSGQPWLSLPEEIRLHPAYPDGLIA